MNAMNRSLAHRRASRGQRGAFLLEALVAILIFAFGILGIVGLQAQAIRNTNDLQFRSEAIHIANAAVGRMWTMNRTQIKASFEGDKGTGGDAYYTLCSDAKRLPGTEDDNNTPTVTVEDGPTSFSQRVTIVVRWQLPGEATPHNYTTTVVVGQNV
jgi:type IV pilus assembly protein PilV